MLSYFETVATLLLRNTPELLAWLIGVTLAALMVRRGGGRAEKLLLTSCCLLAFASLTSPFLSGWVSILLREEGWHSPQTPGVLLQLPMAILRLASLVCLIWAFWEKFRKKKLVAA